eukprot:m.209824 g.209824  ORF g.209824 m.209824 type:complete len:63 (+) comp39728_c0_seq2:1276-1464(+)
MVVHALIKSVDTPVTAVSTSLDQIVKFSLWQPSWNFLFNNQCSSNLRKKNTYSRTLLPNNNR